MNLKKEEKNAFIGTGIFTVGLVILLLIIGFTFPEPPPPLEGVEVNLGYSDDGMGEEQPLQPEQVQSSPKQVVAPERNVQTQNIEQSEYIGKETERVEKTEPVEEKPKIDDNYLFQKNKKGSSQGITGKPGDQGKPGGDPHSKNYTGIPGGGDGISYTLRNRSARSLPKPTYTVEDQGKVVVKVWVNPEGKVTRAEAGQQGTTTENRTLWKHAKEAALKAQFNRDPNAQVEQVGTITYTFLRRN